MHWFSLGTAVSLSEPHTSVTSLRTRVCILLAWTDHLPKILVSTFEIELMHSVGGREKLFARVQCWLPRVETVVQMLV